QERCSLIKKEETQITLPALRIRQAPVEPSFVWGNPCNFLKIFLFASGFCWLIPQCAWIIGRKQIPTRLLCIRAGCGRRWVSENAAGCSKASKVSKYYVRTRYWNRQVVQR